MNSIAICLNNDIKSAIIIGKEVSANMCKKFLPTRKETGSLMLMDVWEKQE